MSPSPLEMLLAVSGFSVHSTVCSWVPLPGYFTERPCTLASIGTWVCSCRCSSSHPFLSRDVVLGLSQRSFRCIGISTRDGTRQISFPLEASSNQSGISPGSHPHLERHAERLPSTVIVAEQHPSRRLSWDQNAVPNICRRGSIDPLFPPWVRVPLRAMFPSP